MAENNTTISFRLPTALFNKIKMTLHKNHLELAKALSIKVWKDPKSNWHKDYIDEKVAKMDKVDTSKPENIWFFINQFDTRRILKLWALARAKGTVTGKELAEFITDEYIKKLETDLKVKVL